MAPPAPTPKKPGQPTGPYTGAVGTTDVSILYPLPLPGGSSDFVRPTEAGSLGALFPAAAFDAVLGGKTLERGSTTHPSTYAALRLVSLRLDPCSARGSAGASCKSEVRAVFQALYEQAAGENDDPIAGTAATDGAVHVMYDVPEPELVTMLQELLTLKAANGGLALQELAPHPILVKQGLGGPFAQGLRSILLAHLGEQRVARATFFDHNFDPESDGWTFGAFDRTATGELTAASIPFAAQPSEVVAGSNALVPLVQSYAGLSGTTTTPDPVVALVGAPRPADAIQLAKLQPVLVSALRIENPTLHNAESTDCANCHLAEGAQRLGESVFALTSPTGFTHARSLARVDERTSVTNLHAFGYLHRKISIMQRTANESVIVADRMAAALAASGK
jgi:hypothetical protein